MDLPPSALLNPLNRDMVLEIADGDDLKRQEANVRQSFDAPVVSGDHPPRRDALAASVLDDRPGHDTQEAVGAVTMQSPLQSPIAANELTGTLDSEENCAAEQNIPSTLGELLQDTGAGGFPFEEAEGPISQPPAASPVLQIQMASRVDG